MEQQKILYAVFAIVITLVALVAIAIVVFPPQDAMAETDTGENVIEARTTALDPSTWVTNSDTIPALSLQKPDEGIIIGIEEDTAGVAAQSPEAGLTALESKREEKLPDSVPSARDLQTPPAPPKGQRPTVRTAPPVATTPAPRPRTVTSVEYWIQAGSFASRTRAEMSRQELKRKGFVCLITSKTVNGVNYYRLRLGPYENKNEAEKFLGWIRNISDYSESYISEGYVQKTL